MDDKLKVRPSDFESIKITARGRNWTSKMKLAQVNVLEIGETHWSLSLPRKSCSQHHSLLLEVTIQDRSTQFVLSLTAQVETIDLVANSNEDQVRVKIIQTDLDELKRFLGLLEKKQEEIHDLLTRMKGAED